MTQSWLLTTLALVFSVVCTEETSKDHWRVERTNNTDYIRSIPGNRKCSDIINALEVEGSGCLCPQNHIFHVHADGIQAGCLNEEMICQTRGLGPGSEPNCKLGYGWIIPFQKFAKRKLMR